MHVKTTIKLQLHTLLYILYVIQYRKFSQNVQLLQSAHKYTWWGNHLHNDTNSRFNSCIKKSPTITLTT